MRVSKVIASCYIFIIFFFMVISPPPIQACDDTCHPTPREPPHKTYHPPIHHYGPPKGSPPKVIPPHPPVIPPHPPVIPPHPPVIIHPPVVPPPVIVPPPPSAPCPPPPGGGGGTAHPPPKVKPPQPPPRPYPKTCPIDALKLGACLDLLGGLVHIGIGDPVNNVCCPVIQGLLDVEAAICLCTAIRLKLLNLNIFLPLALEVLANCGKPPPAGFVCPIIS